MSSKVRGITRLIFFAIGTLFYIMRYLGKAIFVGYDLQRALRLLSQWTRILTKGIGLRIEIVGDLPKQAGLLVCNHRSYTDPFLLFGNIPAVPVGKAAIANWPIIGLAAKVVGAVFISRTSTESKKAARIVIADRLKNGFSVINYAEGTTHTNPQTIDFKPGLFKEAAIAPFPVYPIALEYQLTADAWVGDDVFIRHFLECFGKKNTYARVSFGPAILETDTILLMTQTKDWIDTELLRLRKDWFKEV